MKAIKIGLTLFAMLVMVTFSSAQTEKEARYQNHGTRNRAIQPSSQKETSSRINK